jgi:hypothetical protein
MKGKYGAVEVPADLANSNQVHQPRFAGRIRVLPLTAMAQAERMPV